MNTKIVATNYQMQEWMDICGIKTTRPLKALKNTVIHDIIKMIKF